MHFDRKVSTWRDIALEVIRGKRAWKDLQDAGLKVHRTARGGEFGASQQPPVAVGESDVLLGLRRNLQAGSAGRECAEFILAASDVFDLEPLSATAAGGDLLEAIWDLSRGEGSTAKAIVERADSGTDK